MGLMQNKKEKIKSRITNTILENEMSNDSNESCPTSKKLLDVSDHVIRIIKHSDNKNTGKHNNNIKIISANPVDL